MEGQLWRLLYDLVIPLGKLRSNKKGQIYSDAVIALVMLWACLHDRPVSWACRLENWHGRCPWLALPSQPTMSRRLRTVGLWLLFSQVFDLLNSLRTPGLFKRLDAHPLAVGGASKDVDAKRGHGAGQIIKGYKLHELRSGSGHVDAWRLSAMADCESVVALQLVERLAGGGYVTADNAYDTNALYASAGRHGHQLLAPSRPSAKALGHRPHSPYRLRGLHLLANPLAWCGQAQSFGQQLMNARPQIEREFGHEVSFFCGLKPLPAWVRTPRRVGPWIQCKLIICLLWSSREQFYKHLYTA